MNETVKAAQGKMEKCIKSLEHELTTVRAGRANPGILDKVMVDYYGTPTPIQQMAAVSVVEARNLVIQPWDMSQLKAIERAILSSDIGITPTNDGKVLRLAFPQPTEERRRELVKQVRKYGEEGKVTVRNIRRDALDKIKAQKKNNEITEDDVKNLEKDMQKLTDKFCDNIDSLISDKENEIMSI